MLPIAFIFLYISAYANSATVPYDEGPLPPTTNIDDVQLNSYLDNPITANSLNEIPPNICTTEICEKESALMRAYMDENVNPCENFYEFACGKYIRETILPEDKSILMSFTQVQEKVEEQLRSVLTEKPKLNDSSPFELAKIFNTACLDEDSLREKGITPMVEILEKVGGWPVVKANDWNESNWEWIEANKKLSYEGLIDSFFLSVNIMVDTKNSSKRSIALDQAGFGLASKFLLKGVENPTVRAYYDFMVDTAIIFGAEKSAAEIELLESLELEINLAKIALPAEERRNLSKLYNPYTIQQLQEIVPYINWLEFINWNLNNVIKVDETETVIVLDKNYIQKLETILQSTPKRVMSNYIAWRCVHFTSSLLNDVLHNRRQQYLAATTGMLKSDPRDKECVKRTMDYLSTSVGALYVRTYFNEEAKKGAANLVKSIHEEFLETLKHVPWMDETSRAAAIEKAHKMNYHIAYPNELADNSKLEEYYHGLELETDSLLNNVLRIRKFRGDHTISKLHTAVNKTDWETHSFPTIVNAFYSLLENSIQLPAAVLQDRFFALDRPSYMNYAYIGWFIGHEMTHGFDDEGRQFDSNGNLVDWWQADTAKRFASRAQCIIDQYSNYTDPTMTLRVNGVNTQGENIADNGAVKGMYSAYQKYVERNGPEPILPGQNFTQNQLFWISAAQLWCAVTRPEYDTVQYTTDVHAPNKYRIIGTFSNMESFSRDFKCATGSKMNPVNKCVVW